MKILITGASSGIGQATAYKFAQAKKDLILTYFKNKPGAKKTQQECLKLGAQSAEIFELDLSQEKNILDFTKKIIKQYKSIDILINNAGYKLHIDLENTSFQEIDKQINSNLIGAIKLTKLLLKNIKYSIINIGSTLGFIGKKNAVIYCVAKFGIRGFTKALAKENTNLKINAVNPCLTNTAMGNANGIEPMEVAQIIYNTAVGKYKIKSGLEINVRDYRFGWFVAKIIIFFKKIKNIFL